MRLLTKLLLLVFLLPQLALALACDSLAAGTWATTGSWTNCGGGVPGDGDTVTITHAIDVTGSQTFGTNGAAGTIDMTIGTGGVLDISGTLTARGSIRLTQGDFDMSPGGTFQWNVTNAQYLENGYDWQGSASVNMVCSAVSRCTWNQVAGTFYINNRLGSGYPQRWNVRYVDFDVLGESGTQGVNLTGAGTYADEIYFQNVTFDGLWGWYHGTFMHADANFQLIDTTFVNSNTTSLFSFNAYNSKTGGKTRKLSGVVFDEAPRLWGFQGVEIEDNIFLEGFTTINEAVGAEVSWARNLVMHDGTNLSIYQNVVDDVWIMDVPAKTNPHAIVTPTAAGNLTYDGIIFQLIQSNTDSDGDWIQITSPAGAAVITLQNNIVLPGGSENNATLVTMAGGANVDVNVYHNTAHVSSLASNQASVVVGETYAGHADMVLVKSNIFFTSKTGATAYSCQDVSGTVSGLAPAAAIDYNTSYNITDAAALTTNGFNGSPAHDANSVNEDPAFAGTLADANMEAWDTSLGGAGTLANAVAELALKNSPGFDPNYTVAAFRTYIEEIMTPTNINLDAAGHDGADIGALPYQAAAGGTEKDTLLMGVG